jgi:hypothetical protein
MDVLFCRRNAHAKMSAKRNDVSEEIGINVTLEIQFTL